MPTVHEKADGSGYYILSVIHTKEAALVITYQVSDAGVKRLQKAGFCYHGAHISKNFLERLRDVFREIYTKKTISELITATKTGNTNKVKLLIETKIADVNVKGEDGRTILSLAAERGHMAILQFLLSRKAKVDVEDDYGHDALWWADFNHQTEIVQLLRD